eukprot:813739-Amphidinium_carterae.1
MSSGTALLSAIDLNQLLAEETRALQEWKYRQNQGFQSGVEQLLVLTMGEPTVDLSSHEHNYPRRTSEEKKAHKGI